MVVVGGSHSEAQPIKFIGEVVAEENGVFRLTGSLPYGVVYCGITEHRLGEMFVVGGWLSDLTSTANCGYVDVYSGVVTPGPSLVVGRRYVRAVTLTDEIGRRYSFAIAGFRSDGRPEHTIEILEPLPDPCDGRLVDVLQDPRDTRLVGQATRSDNGIDLTEVAQFSRGAVWYQQQVRLSKQFEDHILIPLV